MNVEYLVDTNVVSEATKSRPDPRVLAWLNAQAPLILPAVGVFELARGIARTSGRKRQFLDEWLAALLSPETRILPFDEPVAMEAAGIEHEARRRGRPLLERDLFILATARRHGLRLATRNLPDFRGHGVSLYDPFDDGHVA
jgi:predicted nucleic acid-binding protein